MTNLNAMIHFLESLEQVSPKLQIQINDVCDYLQKLKRQNYEPEDYQIYRFLPILFVNKGPELVNNDHNKKCVEELTQTLKFNAELKKNSSPKYR